LPLTHSTASSDSGLKQLL